MLAELKRKTEVKGMQHVFIVGSKGIPGAYGGYETFADKLTEYHQNNVNIQYYVACKGKEESEFSYHNAKCFRIKVPDVGAAQAIIYDMKALEWCCKYIKQNNIKHPIIYILACRIGPFLAHYQRKVHRLGGLIYLNPDGHEWMRKKWNKFIRLYWKISERLMVKHSDLIICDSQNIEEYIREEYKVYNPNTTFIAYGAETQRSAVNNDDKELFEWYKNNKLSEKAYYLSVGRFVSENNFETMIREFMKSNSEKNFAIIATANEILLEKLEKKLHFKEDDRIKFVGTVYDKELLQKIRENAYAYLHGHEVGGTNPSLVEALATTDINLLLDVGFNREVGGDAALYWNKQDGNLANLIDKVEKMEKGKIEDLGKKAKQRVAESYSWKYIANKYESVFLANDK